jgi:hypothetical protein
VNFVYIEVIHSRGVMTLRMKSASEVDRRIARAHVAKVDHANECAVAVESVARMKVTVKRTARMEHCRAITRGDVECPRVLGQG